MQKDTGFQPLPTLEEAADIATAPGKEAPPSPWCSTTCRCAFLVAALVGFMGGGVLLGLVIWGFSSVKIHRVSSVGAWQGYGTNLAWWAKVLGQREDLADALFTMNDVALPELSVKLPGLGFTIARYNVGGSSPVPTSTGERMYYPPTFPDSKAIEGFWIDPNNTDPLSSSWNWSVDANQISMLRMAVQRGVTLPIINSNSPMWWMTVSRSTIGGAVGSDPNADNLLKEQIPNFTYYLATVVKHFADAYNITFKGVAAMNEPEGTWWVQGRGRDQEGCHMNVDTIIAVLRSLRQELKKQGLQAVGLHGPEGYLVGQATVPALQIRLAEVTSLLDTVTVHGYWPDGRASLKLRLVSSRIPIWQTEYGDGDPTGATMVSTLMNNMKFLGVSGWAYWQPLDAINWGLLDVDWSYSISGVLKKWYAMAQFSRHIRPGMRILDVTSVTSPSTAQTVAAVDDSTGKFVWVTANLGPATELRYDLGGFPELWQKPVKSWVTDLLGVRNYTRVGDFNLSASSSLTLSLDSNTVSTFESCCVSFTSTDSILLG